MSVNIRPTNKFLPEHQRSRKMNSKTLEAIQEHDNMKERIADLEQENEQLRRRLKEIKAQLTFYDRNAKRPRSLA